MKSIPLGITELYFATFPQDREEYGFNQERFTWWLLQEQYIEPVKYYEIHVSDYRRLRMPREEKNSVITDEDIIDE